MIGAVEGRQYAGRTIHLLEVAEVVLSSQVHAPVPLYPAIRLWPAQKHHGLLERRPNLEHWTILFREVRKERRNISAANMGAERQLTQGNCRDLLGQRGAPEQRAGKVVGDRGGYGTANQVHPAN